MIVFVLDFLLLFSECMFYNREADRWDYVKSTRKIAVRQVVEFILRRGSIDSRHVSEHTPQEGSRLHRMLQKEAGSLYQKEVSLKIEVPLNGHNYCVEGRADGIFVKETGQVVIDEIKTSEPAFEELPPEKVELFWYQAMCYGHMYCQQEQLSEITLQLTYYQTTTKQITRQERHFTEAVLAEFFTDLMKRYEQWVIFKEEWRILRNKSLKNLSFPYGEYRKGQRELAVAVYKTILSKQRLFVEAPTGTGKTMSTLFPAMKAIGEEEGERIFYLTAKTITRQVAEDAVKALSEKQAQTKSITLTAKDKICFLTERNCTPEHCPFADGYYDRLNEGLWDLLQHENHLTREVIERYAQKHQLCPFELSLDASLWCDLIIGDYNYLFDPTVYLRRFFEEPQSAEENIFLVDETHNLVNRSREMYSAAISRNAVLQIQKRLQKESVQLKRACQKVLTTFDDIEAICEEKDTDFFAQRAPIDSLVKQIQRLTEVIAEWLPENQHIEELASILSFYFDCLSYLRISEYYDNGFYTSISLRNYDCVVKQFCVDPAYLLSQRLDKGKASILFSASLTPLNYYQEVLGGGEESLRYRIPYPFPEENQLLMIGSHLQTTYKNREKSYPQISELLGKLSETKTGNYLIFFPSYAYMDDVYQVFSQRYPQVKTQIQGTDLNEKEREAFLAEFKENPQETFIGFCVLGGIFSEGIDLKGTRLIGTIIVSVGLPQMNPEQELIRTFYQEERGQGFQFAYQIPGMNKVLQAAGRVIRDAQDKGFVLLLDERFELPSVQRFFPPHWLAHRKANTNEQLIQQVKQFWLKNKENKGGNK